MVYYQLQLETESSLPMIVILVLVLSVSITALNNQTEHLVGRNSSKKGSNLI